MCDDPVNGLIRLSDLSPAFVTYSECLNTRLVKRSDFWMPLSGFQMVPVFECPVLVCSLSLEVEGPGHC
jgi:hypothetical protein